MPESPEQEWRRLTQLYADMYDGQLLELAASLNELTETAKSVLRDEMRKRRLGDPMTPGWSEDTARNRDEVDRVPEAAETDGSYTEYSWKVNLCDCDETLQAFQISEMLRRAKIEAWVKGSRVLVAADQLDEARAVIANPIPQDIIDASREEIPEYAPPLCPACGAADPILLSAEPSNSWECESCGKEWTEPLEDRAEAS